MIPLVSACFPTSRGEFEGKVLLGEDLVLEQVGHGDLGGGVEPQVVPLQPVHVVLEVGVLSGSGDGRGVHDHRGEHLGVALLLVHVEEEADECSLQPCSVALKAVESGSCDLDGPLEVDDVEVQHQLGVVLGGEVELPLLSPFVDDHVLGVVFSDGNVVGGDVGDVEDAVHADLLELGHLVVVGLDLVPDLTHLGDLLILLLALGHLGDLLGDGVPGLPQLVVLLGELPPPAVGLEESVEDGGVFVPVDEHFPDLLGVGPNHFNIEHGLSP